MLRITENLENGATVRLRLDGTISQSSFAEVEDACCRYQGNQKQTILLDMAGVVFMNNEVASKMAELRNERVKIINCSPFIETLLNSAGTSNDATENTFKAGRQKRQEKKL